MEKYLITGFSGFVSKHFLEFLDSLNSHIAVIGIDINYPEFNFKNYKNVGCQFCEVDLLDSNKLAKVIHDFQPNYILHLASYSSVAFSWKNPLTSFSNNTNIFLNLLEQVRSLNFQCRVLSVGSSEEYGSVSEADTPLMEEHTLQPLSPYAVARVSQEMLSKVYVDGYGMDIVLTRSFNHIGPGQRDIFVISSFAKQLVDIKKNNRTPEIVTGDLSIIRDFLDVRDVVKAYYLLLTKGKKGEVYNICSGQGVTLETLLKMMMKLLGVHVVTHVDQRLIRPNDNPVIIGSNKKLVSETGWEMAYNLEQSLQDILDYWSEKL